MSYSYSTQLSYGTQPPLSYEEQPQIQDGQYVQTPKRSSVPAACAGAGIGLVTGTLIGVNKKPYINNGVPTDTFTKSVYDKYVKKLAPDDLKTSYGQYQEVIKKIDGVKNVDELKTLISNNSEVAKELETTLSSQTADEYLNGIRPRNLKTAKKTIKDKLKAANNIRYEGIKNQITDAWNADKNKFEKPDAMDKKMFKAIRRSAAKIKAACTAKTALIWGAVGGVGTFIAHKVITNKKETSQQ